MGRTSRSFGLGNRNNTKFPVSRYNFYSDLMSVPCDAGDTGGWEGSGAGDALCAPGAGLTSATAGPDSAAAEPAAPVNAALSVPAARLAAGHGTAASVPDAAASAERAGLVTGTGHIVRLGVLLVSLAGGEYGHRSWNLSGTTVGGFGCVRYSLAPAPAFAGMTPEYASAHSGGQQENFQAVENREYFFFRTAMLSSMAL